jgi:hypothetical protein
VPFPTVLDTQLSRGAADFIAAHRGELQRAFNTDELGGPLIHRFWPDLHVFVDDRIFVYGNDFITESYFTVLYGRPGWEDVFDRHDLTAAIVSVGRVSTELLRTSADWNLVYEDDKNAVFLRANDARVQYGKACNAAACCATGEP